MSEEAIQADNMPQQSEHEQLQSAPQPVKLDEERQRKAKAYALIQRRVMIAELILSGLYLVLWVASGWFLDLRAWVDGVTGSLWLQVPFYALILGLPYAVIDVPLGYYTGYVLPHRFGQSTQSFGDWVTDQLKGLGISLILGVILLEVVYWLLRAAPELWWLFAAGVMLLFTVVLSILAPVLIAPLFYNFTPLEDDDLTDRLLRLAERAGTNVNGVFRFDMSSKTKSANAALMGLGSTRRIVLGDTLLDEFTVDEIETVLAHELAHHVHRDIPLLVSVNTILTLVSFYGAHLVLGWAVSTFGLTGIGDPATLPLIGLTLGVIGLVAMPLGNAVSRWRERMADQYALNHTHMPDAFADAMTRLANQNLGEYDPEPWVVFYSTVILLFASGWRAPVSGQQQQLTDSERPGQMDTNQTTLARERRLEWFNEVLYDQMPRLYNAVDYLTFGVWWRLVRRALEYVPDGQRVLEVGFGPGRLHVELATRSLLAIGIDLAGGMCRYTSQRLRRNNLQTNVTRGSVFQMPYTTGAFDTVVSTFAFSGFPDGPDAMHEMARVVSPGGQLVLVDIALPDDGNWLGTRLARLWESMGDFLYDLPHMMQSAGLQVVACEEYGPGNHIRAVVGRKMDSL